MKCRYERIREDRSGAAMAVVLCVTAVFFVLALLFLTMGARMVRASRRELDRSRCRVEAESFSDRLDEALADAGSELSGYLKAQIGGNVWKPGEKKSFVQEEPEGEEQTSRSAGSLTVELSWEYVAEEQARAVRLTVAVTCSLERDSCELVSEYALNEAGGPGNAGEVSWTWARVSRR